MSYQIVSIGGCGAKSVEALTHLCAAGLMPEGELNVLFVDPDLANGCLERAQNSLTQYMECKKIGMTETDLFKTAITLSKPSVWTPFQEDARPSLENFFHYDALKTRDESAALLFDVLFSPHEREVLLDEGFLGHPSIGAAVMAKTVKLSETEPWKSFREKIEQDAKEGRGSKIVLIGSIFGGTGASGIPTISRLIKQEFKGFKNIKIGGVLLLPYFSFTAVEKKLSNGRVFKLNPQNFILNTQAALKYYYNQNYLDSFDCVYLMGEHMLSPVKLPSAGGRNQANDPHFIELYAALSAIDFFKNIDQKIEDPEILERKYNLVARADAHDVEWNDLPDGSNGSIIREKLGRLARFAFAYLKVYHPMLEEIRENEKGYKAPWFIQFFERKGISITDDDVQIQLRNVKEYCEIFLKWLASIHKSSDLLNIKLVEFKSFAKLENQTMKLLPWKQIDESLFENLILPTGKEHKHGLNRLWERMCDARARGPKLARVGNFFKTLFNESLRAKDMK